MRLERGEQGMYMYLRLLVKLWQIHGHGGRVLSSEKYVCMCAFVRVICVCVFLFSLSLCLCACKYVRIVAREAMADSWPWRKGAFK